jgi:hypothetical protein
MEKVYCINCKHYREILHPTESFIIGRKCAVRWEGITTPIEVETWRKNCKDVNKNNDCQDYKRKWYKLWIK